MRYLEYSNSWRPKVEWWFMRAGIEGGEKREVIV